MRIVEILLPKTIMVENVPGLLKDWRLAKVKRKLEELGYQFKAGKLDAQDFGVPQRLKRMILMASRLGGIDLPESADTRKASVRDAIGGLSSSKFSENWLHQYRTKHSESVLERIRKIPKDGGSRSDLTKEEQLPCHKRNHASFFLSFSLTSALS